MKRFFGLVVLALVLVLPCTAFAWERHFGKDHRDRAKSFELYSWRNSLIGNGTVKGMNVDFESDADFPTENRFGGTFCFPVTDTTNLILTYNTFDHSGHITKPVTFENKNYKLGASLRLQNTWIDLTGARVLSNYESGYWDFLYGIKITDSKLDISGNQVSDSAGLTGSWKKNLPIPYIGIGGGFKLAERVLADGHIKFISVNAGGGNVRSYDLDLNLAFELNKPKTKEDMEWYASLGYRKFLIDGSFDNDSVKIGYTGPVFGVMGRF